MAKISRGMGPTDVSVNPPTPEDPSTQVNPNDPTSPLPLTDEQRRQGKLIVSEGREADTEDNEGGDEKSPGSNFSTSTDRADSNDSKTTNDKREGAPGAGSRSNSSEESSTAQRGTTSRAKGTGVRR